MVWDRRKQQIILLRLLAQPVIQEGLLALRLFPPLLRSLDNVR